MKEPHWIINGMYQALTPKRGRRIGWGDPDFKSLRKAAELVVDKSLNPSAAIKQITEREDGEIRHLQDLWQEHGSGLLEGAKHCRDIPSYNPKDHAKAEVGTLALVNRKTKQWDKAGLTGWNLVHGLGCGEVLIRKDLNADLTENEKRPAHAHELARRFQEIDFLKHQEKRR